MCKVWKFYLLRNILFFFEVLTHSWEQLVINTFFSSSSHQFPQFKWKWVSLLICKFFIFIALYNIAIWPFVLPLWLACLNLLYDFSKIWYFDDVISNIHFFLHFLGINMKFMLYSGSLVLLCIHFITLK